MRNLIQEEKLIGPKSTGPNQIVLKKKADMKVGQLCHSF